MLAFYQSLVDDEEEKNIIAELYKSNKRKMYSIAISCLHSPQDAEDAVHEAFLIAIEKNKKIFSIPSNKRGPYLNVIVRNVCYSVLRRKKAVGSIDEEAMSKDKILPEDEVISAEEYEQLLRFLNDLPDGQRDAIYLRCRLGLTMEETALSLSISENAVRNRIFNARKTIRKKLEDSNN